MRREDCISIPERESDVLQQREVRTKRKTRVLMALKCEARSLFVLEREARISTKFDNRISTQHEVHISTKNARPAFC